MRILLLVLALLGAPMLIAAKPVPRAPAHHTAPATPRAVVNWVKTFAATPEGGVRMGNPNAPVKLIEYGSRLCPYCGRFHAESMATLRGSYVASGKVSYEFRDYPVHGALDLAPILIGQCVSTANYFPLLDQMMAAQPEILSHEEGSVAGAAAAGPRQGTASAAGSIFCRKTGSISVHGQAWHGTAKDAGLSHGKGGDGCAGQAL